MKLSFQNNLITSGSLNVPYIMRNLYAGKEAIVRARHEQQTGFKLGKEYVKAVYCHPVYLTYMQSTSCKMPGWMTHSWN